MSDFRRTGAQILRWITSLLDPAAETDRVVMYTKVATGGVPQVFARTSEGNIYQITPVGMDFGIAITPAQITGATPDYNPAGLATAATIRQDTNAAGATISGIAAQGDERMLALYNIGPGVITILHQSGLSAPANRFVLPNSESMFLPVGAACTFIYDVATSRWLIWAQATTRDTSRELNTLNVHDAAGGALTGQIKMNNGNPNGTVSAAQGSLCIDVTATGVWVNTNGATAWSLLSPTVDPPAIGWFGDGSDGTVTWDGATNVLGLVPAGNVYTLTRDVMVLNSTINTGVTVDTAGWRYFDAGTLTINGTGKISRNGNNGGNAAGAAAGAAGAAARGSSQFLADGIAGVGGGAGAGNPQNTGSRRLTAGSVAGGTGGAAGTVGNPGSPGGVGQGGGGAGGGGSGGGVGSNGGAGGAVTVATAINGNDTAEIWTSYNGAAPRSTSTRLGAGTGGGGGGNGSLGGGGGAIGAGGGSGSAGAYCVVAARKLAGTSTSAVQSVGGNGGNGGNAAGGVNGGGGGGGGGAGGIVCVVTTSSTTDWPSSRVSVAGGNGGTGGTQSGTGGPGGTGGAGGSGVTHIFRVGN